MTRVISSGLRGATLGSRFVLILAMARFLDPAEVALYGLAAASIQYVLYAAGLDFYQYTTREIVISETLRGAMARHHFRLVLLAYAVTIPVASSLFWLDLLPWRIALFFFAILPLEHASQEIERMLIAVGRAGMASAVLFVRAGAWQLACTALLMTSSDARTLNTVLGAWVAGGALAVAVGAAALAPSLVPTWSAVLPHGWGRKGLRVALPLLAATLLARAPNTVDRFLIGELSTQTALAAYVLFMGCATGLSGIVSSGTHAFALPSLIAAANEQDAGRFRELTTSLWISTLVTCAVYTAAIWGAVELFLLDMVPRAYVEHASIFPLAMLSVVVFNLALVPQLGLYALHRDGAIVGANLMALFAFAGCCFVLFATDLDAESAVPLSLTAAFIIAGIFRLVLLRRAQSLP